MTEAEVFQLMGLIFAAAGLGLLSAPAFYSRMVEQVSQASTIVYLGGVIRVTIGYLLIRYFTYWGWSWTLILTILGWMSLISGLVILIMPETFLRMAGRIMNNRSSARTFGAVATALGVIFMYLGFFVLA